MKKYYIILVLVFFCVNIFGQNKTGFNRSDFGFAKAPVPISTDLTWPEKMLASLMEDNPNQTFTQARQDTLLAIFNSDSIYDTFGPDGLNKTVCDFLFYMETSNTSTNLTTQTNTKTGEVLHWSNGSTYVVQNNLPAVTCSNGYIYAFSPDGFSGWTLVAVNSNSITFIAGMKYHTGLTTFRCYSNSLTSLETHAEWVSLYYLDCNSNSLTSLETHAEWVSLYYLGCNSNSLTSLETHAEWVSLYYLGCNSNSLTSLETHAEWVSFGYLDCSSNSLTSLETHAEWVSLYYLYCNSNSLTSLETHAEWVSLYYFRCNSNSLTSLETHAEWVDLNYLHCNINNITNYDTLYFNNAVQEIYFYDNNISQDSEIEEIFEDADETITVPTQNFTLNTSGTGMGDLPNGAANAYLVSLAGKYTGASKVLTAIYNLP